MNLKTNLLLGALAERFVSIPIIYTKGYRNVHSTVIHDVTLRVNEKYHDLDFVMSTREVV